jgi:hypothetical protein
MQRLARRFAGLPLLGKAGLVLLTLIVVALSVLLSPFIAVLAGLLLLISILAFLIRAIKRRPLRRWGIALLASFAALVVFSGISEAL